MPASEIQVVHFLPISQQMVRSTELLCGDKDVLSQVTQV